MANKYLDETGLTRLWQHVKALFTSLKGGEANGNLTNRNLPYPSTGTFLEWLGSPDDSTFVDKLGRWKNVIGFQDEFPNGTNASSILEITRLTSSNIVLWCYNSNAIWFKSLIWSMNQWTTSIDWEQIGATESNGETFKAIYKEMPTMIQFGTQTGYTLNGTGSQLPIAVCEYEQTLNLSGEYAGWMCAGVLSCDIEANNSNEILLARCDLINSVYQGSLGHYQATFKFSFLMCGQASTVGNVKAKVRILLKKMQ